MPAFTTAMSSLASGDRQFIPDTSPTNAPGIRLTATAISNSSKAAIPFFGRRREANRFGAKLCLENWAFPRQNAASQEILRKPICRTTVRH
jgi:hypothetical protein